MWGDHRYCNITFVFTVAEFIVADEAIKEEQCDAEAEILSAAEDFPAGPSKLAESSPRQKHILKKDPIRKYVIQGVIFLSESCIFGVLENNL